MFPELERIQQVSQHMFELAENKAWEQLPDLEQERTNLMHAFFENQKFTANDNVYVEKIINSVLLINEKIAKLAEIEKMGISQEMQGLKKRQNVHSAYMQNK